MNVVLPQLTTVYMHTVALPIIITTNNNKPAILNRVAKFRTVESNSA